MNKINKGLSANTTLLLLSKACLELGDRDKAFAELNKAYENHESTLAWLKDELLFDPLRSDPRFQELLKKIGFPQ